MKITKSELRQIIQEELHNVLSEIDFGSALKTSLELGSGMMGAAGSMLGQEKGPKVPREIETLISIVCADEQKGLAGFMKKVGVPTPKDLLKKRVHAVIDSEKPLTEITNLVTFFAQNTGQGDQAKKYLKTVLDTELPNILKLIPGFMLPRGIELPKLPEPLTVRTMSEKGMAELEKIPALLPVARIIAKRASSAFIDKACKKMRAKEQTNENSKQN